MVRDWIAFGIDPEISTLFIQSQVPEHTELHLIFSMLVNLGRLERLPTFIDHLKEIVKVDGRDTKKYDKAKRANVNYGFLGYPILQAADILIYKGNIVPVGEDQVPHIELAREIARKFNGVYGETFPLPESKLGRAPRILGTDGRKMSKRYGNVISPTDDLDTLVAKTRKMVTDPDKVRLHDPGNPYICSVFDLYEVYDRESSSGIVEHCRSGELRCVECKENLAPKIFKTYEVFREKRMSLRDQDVLEVLMEGSKKARQIASRTLGEVKEMMLMNYFC
jgi:tryptophanyl-tRNA synthetase